MKRMLTTLAMMAVLLSLAVVPALAKQNGPIVASQEDTNQLLKIDPETGEVAPLNATGAHPTVTPDGKTVIFDGTTPDDPAWRSRLYEVPLDGSEGPSPIPITNTNPTGIQGASEPAVSPDGKTIYFMYHDGSNGGVASIPINGGSINEIPINDINGGLTVTPDGENLVYGDFTNIMTASVHGGASHVLMGPENTPDPCGAFYPPDPTVSPDGKTVAAAKWGSCDPDDIESSIVTVPFSTTTTQAPETVRGTEAKLSDNDTFVIYPAFSPDGKFLSFNKQSRGKRGIFSVPVGGGPPSAIMPYSGVFYPSWNEWALAPDSTEPVTTATLSPRPNDAGWNNSEVTVTLSATDGDGGSGVEKITYSTSGAQTIAQKDAFGSSVELKLEQEGTTTLTYFATDKAGNDEAPHALTVKIDKTAPSVASTDPWSNATGVFATANIEATFSEDGSGIDPRTLTSDTFNVVQLKPTGNVPVSGTVSYDEFSQTVTFTPLSNLPKGAYRATITTGVQDKASNALAKAYTWQFATAGPSKR